VLNAERRLLRVFRFPLGLLLLFFFSPQLFPQNKNAKKDPPDKSQSVYGVKVNAVVVHVTVTDKAGNPVTDLSADDFKVYDDDKPQNIQTFTVESFGPPESEEENTGATLPKEEAKPKPVKKQNADGPRLISIVIDDLTMESADSGSNQIRPGSILEFPRMVEDIKRFVKSDMGPMDQVAILSGSRKVQFPFSDNKQRVLEELDSVQRNLSRNWAFRSTDPEITDLEAWYIAKGQMSGTDLPFSAGPSAEWRTAAGKRQNGDVEFRTRNLLYTIRKHLQTLTHFEGSKMLVIFSDGFLTQPGTSESYQLQDLVNIALRSGIILNTVSIRSLTVEQELYGSSGGSSNFSDNPVVIALPVEMDRITQEKPLAQLASETGGQFFPRSNNLYLGLKSVAHRSSSYYILTYAMPPHKPDGAYHRIKLDVTRPGLELSYRKGYYVPKEELTFETGKKEDIMEALNAPGDMNQIPMTLSYNYSRADDQTFEVSLITNINIRGLRFVQEDDRRKDQISLVLVAFDETDRYINGIEKSIEFQLLESSYSGLRERGLTSRVELKLPVGRYKIKAVVRESAQGKMGSVTKSVEIP
jgi:VWFA-related protein